MIFGALRIKNESRWIERVIRSIQPLCDQIHVLDDHSTDCTPEICESLGATVYRSELEGLNESRDKQWLLDRVFDAIPEEDRHYMRGNPECPHWLLAIDGDEELVAGDDEILRAVIHTRDVHSWKLRVLYLWNSPDQVRVDGVYRTFARPSLFRLMNRDFRYMNTPFGNGANFHCSSIPQELLGGSKPTDARLLHWGYIDRELRLKKFDWYNRIDPENVAEDFYRHMVIGDVLPSNSMLKHGGPLKLEALECRTPV